MVKRFAVIGVFLLAALPVSAAPPDGDAQIRGGAGDSTIIITTKRRLAGAIHSLKWNGKEFINSADHGRQLQSASSFDNTPTANAETFNPTEAGSRRDGAGNNSTSHLIELVASGNHLHTKTQMAFWLAPGERSEGQLARNVNTLSDYLLTKDVTIGFGRWPQALDYRVTFSVPASAHNIYAQFEALTGYMPPEFDHFWEFNPNNQKLQPLDYGPGEIRNPVVLATADGKYAMGIYSLNEKPPDTSGPGYGRWYFERARVAKWNCVFRVRKPNGIPGGEYGCRMLVPVGTLAQVEAMLRDWRELK